MSSVQQNSESIDVLIRPLREADLADADRITRLAFGTFLGLPDPSRFMGDANYVTTRWKTDPHAAFAAELNGELVGSGFATHWGSVGFFGPLTVRPDLWGRGVASRLLVPILETFDRWGVRHRGLFTFPHSTKHVHLYQKFGFWPRSLTALMSSPVCNVQGSPQYLRFSELTSAEQLSQLAACRGLTDSVYPGLDVSQEIQAAHAQQLGETVLLRDGQSLVGLAVFHCGAGTEAGSGKLYIKFGAVRPSPDSGRHFAELLDACQAEAQRRGAQKIVAGMNMARHEAYRQMLARGFRADMQGVTMHSPNEPGYSIEGVYLIDDWR